MDKSLYPFVLTLEVETLEKPDKVETFNMTVYDELDYQTIQNFVKAYSDKGRFMLYFRRVKWADLKEKNCLLRVWYITPKWLIAFLSASITLVLSHLEKISEWVKQLSQ